MEAKGSLVEAAGMMDLCLEFWEIETCATAQKENLSVCG